MATISVYIKNDRVVVLLPGKILRYDTDEVLEAIDGTSSSQITIRETEDQQVLVHNWEHDDFQYGDGSALGSTRTEVKNALNEMFGKNISRSKVTVRVKNNTVSSLSKGTPVHDSGFDTTAEVPLVIAARADNATAMPATYVLNEDIAVGDIGEAIVVGLIEGVNTSGFSAGDVVYVAPTGGYTKLRPTGSNLVQNIGVITRSHSTEGTGVVQGAGRTNDVPNLQENYIWVGDANARANPLLRPEIPLAHISGRFMWSSVDDGERVYTGSSVYGPHNWYSHSNEPTVSTLRNYSSSHAIDTTTASIQGYKVFTYGIKNPYSKRPVRVDYSFRIYYSGTAPTTGTPFGFSLWSGNAGGNSGSTASSTITLRGESADHGMIAPQVGGTVAHHYGSFTTTSNISDDYLLVLAEHRGSTGLNGTTYMVANYAVYIAD